MMSKQNISIYCSSKCYEGCFRNSILHETHLNRNIYFLGSDQDRFQQIFRILLLIGKGYDFLRQRQKCEIIKGNCYHRVEGKFVRPGVKARESSRSGRKAERGGRGGGGGGGGGGERGSDRIREDHART
ncbi:hypothetical protein V1478_012964 [Vespula squamosa]|uniref:Uncharacterized protein n=1 Tax=Vespula squamosa TaxID=30214 RepID=A0ABD2A9G9_VESSQ